MIRMVFIMALCLAFSTISSAQVVKGTAVWYFDSIPNIVANAAYRGTELAYSIGLEKMYRWDRHDSIWVELSVNVYELDAVADTSTITMPQEGDIAITETILLVRAESAWLQFAGGDDWGDQVVEKDSTLRGDGTSGDPLRVNRDSFLTAAIIEDSLAAVREDILPTDLSFSGATSPVTLQSSTGTDVSFLAGTGMGFSQTGNTLTLNNTGVTGSTSTTTYLPKWTAATVLTGDSRYRFNDAYPALEIFGSYNSNTTLMRLSSGGANPLIQTNTANNGLLMQLGGNGSLYVQNTGGFDRFGINGGSSTAYFPISLLVGGSTTYPARLTTRGSGTTSATYSFIAENSSGTDHFQVRDDGGVFVPVRSGTATALGGWTSDHRATNTTVAPGLTLTAGTLDVNRDSFPNWNDLPESINLYNQDGTLTGNRTVQLHTATLEFFREDNDFPDYGNHTNFYERTGIDTFLIPVNTYNYPIVGKMFSLNGENSKVKVGMGWDPDWSYGGAFVGSFVINPTEFYEGTRYSFMHNAGGAFHAIAAHDTVSRRVMFTYSRAGGLTIDRRDLGNVYAEFKHSTKPGLLFTSEGMKYDGTAIGQTFISNNIETVPYETNYPTALTGWSTAPVAGSRYLSEIHLGNLRFSNDTLLSQNVALSTYATKTVANTGTATSLEASTKVGSSTVVNLKAGNSYKIEAWGYYTTDTINTNIEIRFQWNGSQICTTGSRALTVTEGGEFKIEAIVTVYALGSPGSLFTQGRAEFMHSESDSDVYRMLRTTNNSITVLETGTALELTADWTTASTANSITCTNLVITPLIY